MGRVTLTVKEVAQALGVNVNAAYELVKQKDFPSIKVGRRILIPEEAFNRWLNNKAEEK